MRTIQYALLLTMLLWGHSSVMLNAQTSVDLPIYPGQDRIYPFYDAAGTDDSTAIAKDDTAIVAWATGADVVYGTEVDATWQTPTKALGAAQGTSTDIVCLGRGGQITLTFANPITNGDSFDFAIFENSFSSSFLELAWVEVSSDGEHFVRFPNLSYTDDAVSSFGPVLPIEVHGFAGKYKAGYGTPFDLSQLKLAYEAARDETDDVFTDEYKASLLSNYSYLNIDAVTHVRLIDVVGDGSAHDVDGNVVNADGSQGGVIYDPYPTFGSAGFELDAVAVLHQLDAEGIEQSITFSELGNRRIGDGSFQLSATATSDLPVSYELISGPAEISDSTLTPTGLGQVLVQAIQAGDATYAAASPVTRSFYVADELQHIFIKPPSNQLVGTSEVFIDAVSSSGLTVSLFISDGPNTAVVSEFEHIFDSGSEAGQVTLRASVSGGELDNVVYAPAADVFVYFDIVASSSDDAPQSFTQWQEVYSISSATVEDDSDGDGFNDLQEYAAGTAPTDASDRPSYGFSREADSGDYILELSLNSSAQVDWEVQTAESLGDADAWSLIIPEILELLEVTDGSSTSKTLKLRVPNADAAQQFWRLQIDTK
jgi:hypothetical protein